MQTACLGTRAALGDDSDTAWNCARAPGTAEQSALTDLPASVDASRARVGRGVAGASHGLSKEAARARRYLGSPGALQHYRMVGTSTGMPPDTQAATFAQHTCEYKCVCVYTHMCVPAYAGMLLDRCCSLVAHTYHTYLSMRVCTYVHTRTRTVGTCVCVC